MEYVAMVSVAILLFWYPVSSIYQDHKRDICVKTAFNSGEYRSSEANWSFGGYDESATTTEDVMHNLNVVRADVTKIGKSDVQIKNFLSCMYDDIN